MDNCTHCNETSHSEANTVVGFFHLIISVLSIAANFIVMFTIVMRRQLHHPTLWLISLMALFDLLFALYYMVFVVPSAFFGCFAYDESLLRMASIIRVSLHCQNIQTTMLVALDRYISVNWPLRYLHIVTNRTCATAALATFILNIGISLLLQLSSGPAFYNAVTSVSLQEIKHIYGAAILGLFVWGCFGVIIFCSVKLLKAVLRSRQKIVSIGQQAHPVARSSFMVLISSIVFFVTYIPIPINYMLAIALGKENIHPITFRLTSMIISSSGLWNVFIYCATYHPFREALMSLMCKKLYRKYRQAEAIVSYTGRQVKTIRQT